MEVRDLFDKIFGKDKKRMYNQYKLISSSSSFSPWDGKVYNSDIVRSCIRPKERAIGKLKPIHIRTIKEDVIISPNPAIKMLLRFPNESMSMQKLLEKMVIQRELNNNAFAIIKRDSLNRPTAIYPINTSNMELVENNDVVYCKFRFTNGKTGTVPYDDVIHLRKDFNDNDFYGTNSTNALTNLMQVIDTTDKGIIKSIKNSSIIKWLMKFNTVIRSEDKLKEMKLFNDNYLNVEKSEIPIASSDPRYNIEQVKENSYTPNGEIMDKYEKRVKNYFGVNDSIINNSFTEDQWNAFYEAEIEPVAKELSDQFTAKLFTKHEIECGNEIIFEASSLEFSSMKTKLELKEMVDRGAMNTNEWRRVMNLGATEFGDEFIRRLDTAPIENVNKEGELNE